jgi:hypothetical protein
MLMKEGISGARDNINNMASEISKSKIIAKRIMSEHSGYLLEQLIPKFDTGISRLTQALEGSEGFTRSDPNRMKAIVVTKTMEALQANLLNFKRYVSVFDDDRESSFSKHVVKMEQSMIGIVGSLNKAGLSLGVERFSPQKNNIPKELRR